MRVWLGIDASGSSSKIIAIDKSENVISSQSGPSIQASTLPLDETAQRIRGMIDAFIEELKEHQIVGIGIGISGLGREVIQKELAKKLNTYYPDYILNLNSDAMTNHLAAFNDENGLLIIAGTGTIIMAKYKNHWIRAGGFGHQIGDYGSGLMLGQQFLQYLTGLMELNAESEWSRILSERYDLNSMDDLLHAIYHKGLSPAHFAPLLIDKAEEGNRNCQLILTQQLRRLARQVFLVQQKLPGTVNRFAISGNLALQKYYNKQLKSHIFQLLPDVQWLKNVKEPALGACRLVTEN